MFSNESLLVEFFDDTQTHLENIEAELLKLEKDPGQKDIIDSMFRMVHSVKGNAGLLGLDNIHESGTSFETFLDAIRGRQTATAEEVDSMFTYLDGLKHAVRESKGDKDDTDQAAEIVIPEKSAQEPTPEPGSEPVAVESSSKPTTLAKDEDQPSPTSPDAPKDGDDPEAHAAPSEPATFTFLTFNLDGESYGIDIMNVREIILHEDVTPVPNTKRFVLGVMNLRDQIIPVFDIKDKLGIEKDDRTCEERNIIVVEISKSATGMKVDEVTGIVTLPSAEITSAEHLKGSIPTECVFGMGRTDKQAVILLNAMSLCDPDECLF